MPRPCSQNQKRGRGDRYSLLILLLHHFLTSLSPPLPTIPRLIAPNLHIRLGNCLFISVSAERRDCYLKSHGIGHRQTITSVCGGVACRESVQDHTALDEWVWSFFRYDFTPVRSFEDIRQVQSRWMSFRGSILPWVYFISPQTAGMSIEAATRATKA